MDRPNFFRKLLDWFKPGMNYRVLARQLRHPKGRLGTVVGKNMNISNERLYDFTLETMALQDQQSVFELGFGNGAFFERILNSADQLKVTGIDFSESMVRHAREINSHFIESGQLKILYGNCQALPFDAGQFDKIFCINVIYFWDDPTENLREIYRVLKPGGKFYATFRLRESMKLLPFTQFGFTLYDIRDWEVLLERNRFLLEESRLLEEPEADLFGEKLTLRSACIVGRKPVPVTSG